jgi:hypothetical protein
MMVNSLKIPDALVNGMRTGKFRRRVGSWQLRKNQDAFGNPLETELGEISSTASKMAKETAQLASDFSEGVGDGYGTSDPEFAGPGAIDDILDFSNIVCFGCAGDDSPFCLDFRLSPDRPQVIWWDDVYWRLVAPDVESFLALFNWDKKRSHKK